MLKLSSNFLPLGRGFVLRRVLYLPMVLYIYIYIIYFAVVCLDVILYALYVIVFAVLVIWYQG